MEHFLLLFSCTGCNKNRWNLHKATEDDLRVLWCRCSDTGCFSWTCLCMCGTCQGMSSLWSLHIYIYTCILPIQCENRWFAETPHLKELIRGFVFLCLWIFSLCFYSCPPHVTRPEVAECLFVVWCLSLSQESQPQWDSSTVLISRDLLWSNFTLLPWVHAHMDVTCSLMNSLSYQGRMTHLYVETLKTKVLLKTSNGSCLFFFWPIPETERRENQYKGLFSQFK